MKKTKRVLSYLITILLTFSFVYIMPNAEEYIILSTNKWFKNKPTTANDYVDPKDPALDKGKKVIVLDKNIPKGYGCSNNWYKVKYEDKTGYICSTGLSIVETADVNLDESFEQEMLNKGFPASYLPYLKALHLKHPNWTFTADLTNLDFNEAVSNENIADINLVNGSDESLRSKEYPYYQNGTYIEQEKGGWYVANRSTVSYYMDPRNFLTEDAIFMFESVRYNKNIHTSSALKNIIKNSFLDTDEYYNLLLKAANNYNINPLYLASKIKQEKGTVDSIGTTGGNFKYEIDNNCLSKIGSATTWTKQNSCGNNQTYSGIYNYYNIGAYSSYKSPAIRGLIWANGGIDSSVTSYLRPWKSKESGLLGGASYIASKFINNNQHTIYYQKFNVSPLNSHKYVNQYMANVKGHYGEALKVYNSYKNTNLLNSTYEFLIPVYNNMPNETDQSKDDNNNNNDNKPSEDLPTNTVNIDEGIIASGIKLNDTILYGFNYKDTITDVNNRLNSISATLKVTSYIDKNGKAAQGSLGTGDKLTITNGKSSKTYTVIIYGDSNGDGKIDVVDLSRCKKYLLGNNNLSATEQKAIDINKDGKIDVVDLLGIKKQLLGAKNIEQR